MPLFPLSTVNLGVKRMLDNVNVSHISLIDNFLGIFGVSISKEKALVGSFSFVSLKSNYFQQIGASLYSMQNKWWQKAINITVFTLCLVAAKDH